MRDEDRGQKYVSPWRDEVVSLAGRSCLTGGTELSHWRDEVVALPGRTCCLPQPVLAVGKAPHQSIASRVSRVTHHVLLFTF
jgi:hypothetical protein